MLWDEQGFSRDSIKQFDFHWLLNITFLHGEIPILPGLLWSSITLFSFNISLALALQHFPVNPPYIYISFFTTVQKHNCAHLGSICHSICSRSHDLRRWGCQQAGLQRRAAYSLQLNTKLVHSQRSPITIVDIHHKELKQGHTQKQGSLLEGSVWESELSHHKRIK